MFSFCPFPTLHCIGTNLFSCCFVVQLILAVFCFVAQLNLAILFEILTIFASIRHYCTSRVPFCSDRQTHFVPVADLHLQKFTRSAYNSVSIHPYTKVLELPRGAYLGHPLFEIQFAELESFAESKLKIDSNFF